MEKDMNEHSLYNIQYIQSQISTLKSHCHQREVGAVFISYEKNLATTKYWPYLDYSNHELPII